MARHALETWGLWYFHCFIPGKVCKCGDNSDILWIFRKRLMRCNHLDLLQESGPKSPKSREQRFLGLLLLLLLGRGWKTPTSKTTSRLKTLPTAALQDLFLFIYHSVDGIGRSLSKTEILGVVVFSLPLIFSARCVNLVDAKAERPRRSFLAWLLGDFGLSGPPASH